MRIIKRARLVEFWTVYPGSRSSLERWFALTRGAHWHHFAEVKMCFPAADVVKAASGSTCIVFDIAGNHYRMITAIHFNRQIVHVLRILTHPEYDTGQWRKEL